LTPISLVFRPSFAYFKTRSSISAGLCFIHVSALGVTGLIECDCPCLCECILPIDRTDCRAKHKRYLDFAKFLIFDTKVKYERSRISWQVLYVNKPIIIGAVLLSLFAASAFLPMAAAQSAYPTQGGYGGSTLEEQLKLAHAKVTEAAANPHTGSGTPVLDAGGVAGASIVVGAIFGGIFLAFVIRAKQAQKTRQ
jgi:hypothetical protein